MKKLIGALPSGSLQQPCLELWRSAGYRITVPECSFFPQIDDPDIALLLLDPQEIHRYVAEGRLDFGICKVGFEYVQRVVTVAEFMFSKVSRHSTMWVVAAVPNDSAIKEPSDLAVEDIDTSWPGFRGEECKKRESTSRFIASPQAFADPWKKQKMEDIALLLRATLDAEGKVGLMMNAKRSDCDAIVDLLPALHKPTTPSLSDPDWVSISSIVDETVVRQIIPALKRAGAEGIVEFPVSKLIR